MYVIPFTTRALMRLSRTNEKPEDNPGDCSIGQHEKPEETLVVVALGSMKYQRIALVVVANGKSWS